MLNNDVRFLEAERSRHRPIVQTICYIGIAVLALYVLSGPVFMPGSNTAMLYAAATMMALIGVFVLVVKSRWYLTTWWIEAPFFVALFCAQLNVNRSFFDVSVTVGSTPFSLVLYNAVTFLVAMVVGLCGSFASFATAATLVVAICSLYTAGFAKDWTSLFVQLGPLYTAFALSLWANYSIWSKSRSAWATGRELEAQKAKTETLLHNVLPGPVAERLRNGDTIADAFSEVSVIFVDLVGFSQLSRTLSPRHLVEVLNRFFMLADQCAEKHQIEKVKTIGDAYLAVAGATIDQDNCALAAIAFAQDLMEQLSESPPISGLTLQVRVGIHTGAVVGGVIGTSRMAYDYWGDTVNLASRVQGAAEPGSILTSESTYYRANEIVVFGQPRIELLKGIGETKVYPVLS